MKPLKGDYPCRGCAGTGIGSHLTPREAQVLMQKINLTRATSHNSIERHATRYCRIEPWTGLPGEPVMRGRMAMSGALIYVIAEVKRWLADGWELAPGSIMPDESACCKWCGGSGRPAAILTVHEMEEALCRMKP